MAFVIDSQEWNFNGWTAADIQGAIENILERLDRAFQQQQDVWVGEELQTQHVYGTKDLWSLRAKTSNIQIDEEVWQELAAALGRTKRYLDEDTWPQGFDDYFISTDGAPPYLNPDIAWAHHNVRACRAVGCIGIKRKGIFPTVSKYGSATVHWLSDRQSWSVFWRQAIIVEGNTQATLERLAPYAYPGLYFVPDVWRGLQKLNGGYYPHRYELQRYLSILSDSGGWALTAPPPAEVISEAQGTGTSLPTSQLIIRRFVRLQLDVTPENPDVYRNTGCREAREINLFGKTLYFAWHGKLQAYQNRIHIHAPVNGSNGKVLIGIIDSHLPLPP